MALGWNQPSHLSQPIASSPTSELQVLQEVLEVEEGLVEAEGGQSEEWAGARPAVLAACWAGS